MVLGLITPLLWLRSPASLKLGCMTFKNQYEILQGVSGCVSSDLQSQYLTFSYRSMKTYYKIPTNSNKETSLIDIEYKSDQQYPFILSY